MDILGLHARSVILSVGSRVRLPRAAIEMRISRAARVKQLERLAVESYRRIHRYLQLESCCLERLRPESCGTSQAIRSEVCTSQACTSAICMMDQKLAHCTSAICKFAHCKLSDQKHRMAAEQTASISNKLADQQSALLV